MYETYEERRRRLAREEAARLSQQNSDFAADVAGAVIGAALSAAFDNTPTDFGSPSSSDFSGGGGDFGGGGGGGDW